MDFDFSAEQQQLRDMARRFLEEHASSARVRRVLDGPEPFARELWRGLAELGLIGAAIPEAYGGAGLGFLELCVIAEELGRCVAPVPFSPTVCQAAELLLMAGSEEQKRQWLPGIAAGDLIGTVILPAAGPIRLEGSLHGTAFPVADGDAADFAIVTASEGEGLSLFIADLRQGGVGREKLDTIDPLRSHGAITFTGAAAEWLGEPGAATALLDAMIDKAAVLMAFEQVGGADRTVEMARDHALERRAFGRQIGSFQAIKHMLADMYVEATLARSNAYYAAWALSQDALALAEAAAGARVSATLAYRHCARNAIQVHGGMGFTWEHDCHLHFRRANLLAQSFGPLSQWEAKLVNCLRERGGGRRSAA